MVEELDLVQEQVLGPVLGPVLDLKWARESDQA